MLRQHVAGKGAGGGWPELRPDRPVTQQTYPSPPDGLMKPQSSSQHRPTTTGAGLELWAHCRLPQNAVPQSWRHGRGRLRTSTPTMPPAPMGGAWHLESIEAPQTSPNESGLVSRIGLKQEKRGNLGNRCLQPPFSANRLKRKLRDLQCDGWQLQSTPLFSTACCQQRPCISSPAQGRWSSCC